MTWFWKTFAELSLIELYQIIQLRERVFVVEQNCVYLDCDGRDQSAWHLLGYREGQLVAYLRAFQPNPQSTEAVLGRVVTSPEARGGGLGKELTRRGIENIQSHFSNPEIRISAQAYLQKFYEGFGFKRVGEEYLEDNIPHIQMRRFPAAD